MDKLGKKAKDILTGFEGIITSKHSYLTGCTQYGIQPPMKDGNLSDMRYFDEGRIQITGDGIDLNAVRADEPGCDFRERP